MASGGQGSGSTRMQVLPGTGTGGGISHAADRSGSGGDLVFLPAANGNLPRELSSFVGREQELAGAADALAANSLVTVTGGSGMGKTRLALQLARRLAPGYREGAWLVELASLRPSDDPSVVAEAVADVLDVRPEPGRSFTDAVVTRVRRAPILLVLDNCEHLVAATAGFVTAVLDACPALSLLVTSQAPLGVGGEQVWPLAPLSLPAPGRVGAGSDAVALFHARARSVNPGFAVTGEGIEAVAEICRRLDGIPLAIELAAGRTSVLSPAEIAEHLDQRFSLLTRPGPSTTSRHQSLQSALDWSWELLSTAEQALLRRLSVFAGGAGLSDVRAVCTGGEVAREEVVDLLAGLVSKSLVVADTVRPRARYRLLEPVRAYARDQLESSGEADAVAERHAMVFVGFAEQGWHQVVVADHRRGTEALDLEHDNLRVALGWLLSHGEAGTALRLSAALTPFWRVRGHFRDGRECLERALAAAPEAPAHLRARGLWGVGILAIMQGDLDRAAPVLEESLALARANGIDRATMQALNLLAFMSVFTQNPVTALPLLEESVALARTRRDTDALVTALALYGRAHLFSGGTAAARDAFGECLELGRAGGDESGGLIGLGWVALSCGEHERAAELFARALPMVRDAGERFETALVLSFLGELAWCRGDDAQAKARLDEGVSLSRAMGAPFPLARCLLGLGRLAQGAGEEEVALDLVEEATAVARRAQLNHVLVRCLLAEADLFRSAGDLATARARLEAALAIATDKGDKGGVAQSLGSLGRLAHLAGDYQRATTLHLEALDLQVATGDLDGVAGALQGLAGLAVAQDRAEHAARLLGAAQAVRQRSGGWASAVDRADREAAAAVVQGALDGADFEEMLRQGAALALGDAVALATRSRGGRKRPDKGWASLTATERQVVDLVADGLTNPEIAERMFISPRTVQSHLTRAFPKVGVSSRRELREAVRSRR